MKPNELKKWRAEKYGMERTFTMITGKTIKVLDVEPECKDEIGYTSADGKIHLAYDHPIMDKLKADEKAAFRKGVFAHEMLHQIFTDFRAHEQIVKTLPAKERQVFAMLANILEDPSIEYWASTVIGGPLLSALKFSIAYIYKQSPKITESKSPMTQFIGALIHFGDMGIVKGNFTFPEARKCFKEAAPIFAKGITEPLGKNRLKYAKEIMEISRPLWQADADFAEMIAELLEALSANGKSQMKGSGTGKEGDEALAEEDGKKAGRRKVTIKKVSKEELEEMTKNGEVNEGPIPDDGDITLLVCDEETEKNPGKGTPIPFGEGDSSDEKSEENSEENSGGKSGKKSDKKEEKESSEDSGGESSDKDSKEKSDKKSSGKSSGKNSDDNSGEKSGEKSDEKSGENTDGNSDGNSENSSGENSKNENSTENKNSKDCEYNENSSGSNDNPFRTEQGGNPKVKASDSSADSSDDTGEIGEITDEEYEISDEDLEYIVKEVERIIEDMENSDSEDAADDSAPEDFDVSGASPYIKGKTCLNYRVKNSSTKEALESQYGKVLSTMMAGINATSSQLKKIFQNDQEEREYRTSGRINLKRVNNGRVTSRIFDRRKSPAEKSNLIIEIIVDESGSMSGRKITAARDCCIALAEIFASLNIPVYIIGFTADTQGYDVVHNHYISWKNTKGDRLKLLNISARCDNCDGYSIRYATEIIKKKEAKNKLLIVISDGQPAAYSYSNGVADTKIAIKEAKKHASVLGVAIGNNDTETIRYMYEEDFLHVGNVNDLFNGLSRKIKKIIKSWE